MSADLKHLRGREERMDEQTGKPIVMPIGQFIINKHWNSTIFILQTLLNHGDLLFWHLQTRPTIPLECCCFGQTAQTTDEATGRHGKVIFAVFRAFYRDG